MTISAAGLRSGGGPVRGLMSIRPTARRRRSSDIPDSDPLCLNSYACESMKLHVSSSGKTMRILVINVADELGGVELHCVALAEFLAGRGHQVTVAVLGPD